MPEGDTVGVSQQLQCSATIKPSTASGQTLTWASTDSSIASVDQNGLITTHKAGEVTITAEAPNGVQGELFLDVLPAYFDIIGEHEYTVTRGEKISIPIRLYIDGSISPDASGAMKPNATAKSFIPREDVRHCSVVWR